MLSLTNMCRPTGRVRGDGVPTTLTQFLGRRVSMGRVMLRLSGSHAKELTAGTVRAITPRGCRMGSRPPAGKGSYGSVLYLELGLKLAEKEDRGVEGTAIRKGTRRRREEQGCVGVIGCRLSLIRGGRLVLAVRSGISDRSLLGVFLRARIGRRGRRSNLVKVVTRGMSRRDYARRYRDYRGCYPTDRRYVTASRGMHYARYRCLYGAYKQYRLGRRGSFERSYNRRYGRYKFTYAGCNYYAGPVLRLRPKGRLFFK